NHTEHTVRTFGVGQYVTVEGPCAWLCTIDDNVPALAWSNVQGVTHEWLWQLPTVLGDNQLWQTVQVHWVDQQTLVHIANTNLLAKLSNDWLGCWETLTVDGETTGLVVKDHYIVDIRWVLLFLWIDDECSQQTFTYLSSR